MFYYDRKRTLSESGLSERVTIRRKGGRMVYGRGWCKILLSECESCGGCELRKEFARLFICRKGERTGALCGYGSESVCGGSVLKIKLICFLGR